MPRTDFQAILKTLVEHAVDFIVVGGVAAVLEGAPMTTFDLDVVHATGEPNIGRLLAALADLDAYYRAQPERCLRPGPSHLASPGHQLLMTRFGPLDLLGSIGHSHRYEDLLPHAVEMKIGESYKVRVLELGALIRVKEETGGEKDLAVLPLLRRTLEERRRHAK
jgi:predicted nucleotidyltransferase